MSTFYAVIEDLADARRLAHELLRAGLRADDLSMLCRDTDGADDFAGTVGDATAFVGREDDPIRNDLLPHGEDITDKTSIAASPIMGIDTSNSATDVDSVDQSDDSQTYAEESIQPLGEISQAEHERDDLEMAISSGFPTPVPVIDDIQDTATLVQEQLDQEMQTLVVPAVGTVMGGGSLSTAAIGFTDPSAAIVANLVDEGMTEERARLYASAYRAHNVIFAAHVDPGDVREGRLEEYISRHKVRETDLIDAPRFYENGGKAKMI